ncbi:pentapeptide repeat-containing protein [Marine Group I thaumarchaeote]|nr:pentapeptide repeat-containing protein [Marine Group I thaumarchaeote]
MVFDQKKQILFYQNLIENCRFFHDANLTNANLTGANFHMADLTGANLEGVIINETNLSCIGHDICTS